MVFSVAAARGTLVQQETVTPGTFATLIGAHNGPKGPGFEAQMIEATYHDIATVVKRMTRVNVTPVTFDLFYDTTDTAHLRLMSQAHAGTITKYKITLTDQGVEVYAFDAIPSISISADNEGFVVASVTLNIVSDITIT